MGQKQHCDKQDCDHPGASFDLPDISAEDADNNVGNQAESDTVGDIVGKRHNGQRQECGDGNFQIIPIVVLRSLSLKKRSMWNLLLCIGVIISCLYRHFHYSLKFDRNFLLRMRPVILRFQAAARNAYIFDYAYYKA